MPHLTDDQLDEMRLDSARTARACFFFGVAVALIFAKAMAAAFPGEF
jgi:hypothetical protein